MNVIGNLLNKETILKIFPNGEPSLNLVSTEQIANLLLIFTTLSVNPDYFNILENHYVEIRGGNVGSRIHVSEILRLAFKLNDLKNKIGFTSLAVGFNNPTQFSSTSFEVDCMYMISKAKNVSDLEIIPPTPKLASPDFKILTSDKIEIYCECKSLASASAIETATINRLSQILSSKLINLSQNKYRIEIQYKNLPNHWNRNLDEQVEATINQLIEKSKFGFPVSLVFKGYLKLNICVSDKFSPRVFSGIMNIADSKENPNFVISHQIDLRDRLKRNLKAAQLQFPDNFYKIIFIESVNENYAKKSIQQFFSSARDPLLLGVLSANPDFNVHQNPFAKKTILELI